VDLSPEAIQKLADYFELLQETADEIGFDVEKEAILEPDSGGTNDGT
jgi:hypothetical protein